MLTVLAVLILPIAAVWGTLYLALGTPAGLIACLYFATTLPALALGAGFALPLLLAGVPIRVALVLAGRRTLR